MNHSWRRKGILWALIAGALAYFPIGLSLLLDPHRVGPDDWQLDTAYMAAFRRIVLEFRQFPWWNPYSMGGFPFFANPINFGAFSLPSVLTLILGATPALKLSVLLMAVVGFEGMRRLASRSTAIPLYATTAGILFACNGGIMIHLSVGHLFWDYFFYPWILLGLAKLHESPSTKETQRTALLTGIVWGLSAQSALHYGLVYQSFTVGIFFICGLWRHRAQKFALRDLALAYGLLGSAFLMIAGSRIMISLALMGDYPRAERWEMTAGFWRLLKIYFYPKQSVLTEGGSPLGWWEWGCYVGVFSALAFVASLRRGIRYYHVIFVLGVLLFTMNKYPWPYYWLNSYVPLFKSMRIAARLRIWLMPFFALAVVIGLEVLGLKNHRLGKVLALLIMADLSWVGYSTLNATFADPKEAQHSLSWPQNHRVYPVTYQDRLGPGSSLVMTVQQNFGHTPGYEPSVSPLLWARPLEELPLKGFNSPEYKGEFYTDAGPVEPTFWSPNKIVFEGLSGPLNLNMNLGSYWTLNGNAVFAKNRVAEIDQKAVVEPDSQGRVVLEVHPKGLAAAWGVTLFGLGACLLFWWAAVRNFRLRGVKGDIV